MVVEREKIEEICACSGRSSDLERSIHSSPGFRFYIAGCIQQEQLKLINACRKRRSPTSFCPLIDSATPSADH